MQNWQTYQGQPDSSLVTDDYSSYMTPLGPPISEPGIRPPGGSGSNGHLGATKEDNVLPSSVQAAGIDEAVDSEPVRRLLRRLDVRPSQCV